MFKANKIQITLSYIARFCEETRDCDPLFICVDQECICRFGQTPCRPPLFGFAPLNALPRFHQDLSQRPYNFQ
ncbi:unnamed protein product [Auanema sp. JU1783]|nr:unnamed protein product [Auanema sp. JU1783]